VGDGVACMPQRLSAHIRRIFVPWYSPKIIYNCYFFRVRHFEKVEIFGGVVNLNIFTRIFRHSTVHLDLRDFLELKEFRDLELIELKEFEDLELKLLNS
jgi:hypothetical protein